MNPLDAAGAPRAPAPLPGPIMRPVRRLTPSRIINASLAMLIIMICADAVLGAFLLAFLELLGFGRSAILWAEAALLGASLIPGVWLFRRVLDAECRLDEGTYD